MSKVLEAAQVEWDAGCPHEAGRLVYQQLAPEQRPGWAGTALELVRPRFPVIPEVEAEMDLTRSPSRWPEGHAVFSAVRELTLQAEREAGPRLPDPQKYSFFLLAENAANVVYNASGAPAPFDPDCGWWIAACLHSLVGLLDDHELRQKAREVLCQDGSSSARLENGNSETESRL